ncbi:hypothetical protein PHLGIDRAFT_130133 [Phlebiopsis gigantea 11061_1 CR5-6]|uniref:Adenylate cyclase n=1 Tax=Phlebiopsis gigantea (strain 11061_1 CR5-6) TaxID=745531 RepID=A0A0C3S1Y1_PHLG1|nr:hypothetical protein PHLGIDRAFT_130133 [Phlebiopsis gigantea 11061_1 CR5-6]
MASSITLGPADDFLPTILPPQDLQPHAPSTDNAVNGVIAPWLVDDAVPEVLEPQETPTTQGESRSMIIRALPSIHNIRARAQRSTATGTTASSDTWSIHSGSTSHTSSTTAYADSTHTIRDSKKKPFYSKVLQKARSRSGLRIKPSDLTLNSSLVPPVPSMPSPDYIPYNPPVSPPANSLKKPKRKLDQPPPVPSKDTEFTLDKDIDNMDGIIDLAKHYELNSTLYDGVPESPSSGFESSVGSSGLSSDYSTLTHQVHHQRHGSSSSLPIGPLGIFRDPFHASSTNKRPRAPQPQRESGISPKSRGPFSSVPTLQRDEQAGPGWKAPDSWAVEKGVDDELPEEESSSDGEDAKARKRPRRRNTLSVSTGPKGSLRERERDEPYRLRIYRWDNTYHVATVPLRATVSELIPYLNRKVLHDNGREQHRLYLKERGRERLLAMSEKPASIVRRRLEQAGYDHADDLRSLAVEDIQYLMKFVYKSNDDELVFEGFESVDLAARALKTVPVVLYSKADLIVQLNLSRNPMLEIPRDFLEACTTLRSLRLQSMSMKRVPQSLRCCETLHRLDLSSNRIVNLDDAGLDHIPSLKSLKLQNNGMQKLPWYFPRIRSLKELNISNNKFEELPDVVCKLSKLIDLDVSFNLLTQLPGEIGDLVNLERLTIVGNQVTRFPNHASNMRSLRVLDCRRNHISDLSTVCLLPYVETIYADHNSLHALDLSFGPCLQTLDVSHNDITQLTPLPGDAGQPFAMVHLDISHAKLSSLDELALSQLTSLHTLRVDHNALRALPDSVGDLFQLKHLSCSNNQLYSLPDSISKLQKLEILEAHNNSLEELTAAIWECSSLTVLNLTSNLLGSISGPSVDTPTPAPSVSLAASPPLAFFGSMYLERKTSTASSLGRTALPPLAYALERLYLGENRLNEDHLHPLTVLHELRVLNLSFNHLQVVPNAFLKNLIHLQELYLSGNDLTALPTEDLPLLSSLRVLYLNGNNLQSLPQELGKIQTLQVLDVGSNALKYNINNWEFDWNWNFNPGLKYLNLSGNKRLEIKPDHKAAPFKNGSDRKLADFSELKDLRVLGLMDVTTTFAPNIPDDNEDRRVRTSLSEVCNMAYGIADTLGQNLSMFDLVQPNFRNREDEAIFAMFGRASHIGSNNRLSKWLHDNYPAALQRELDRLEETEGTVDDAMRRSFLKINRELHDWLYSRDARRPSTASATTANIPVDFASLKSGASGVVLYFCRRTLYVANAGNALAVISHQGNAKLLSRKHDPFDRQETARIRAAEGWISPKGFVNDEIDVSRSFGFYYLLPVLNARPDVIACELGELDEFVIIANRGLWDFVSYQTAVDIARSERDDPMIAAQKLRDFAISYGAEGTTMIMVISVSGLFGIGPSRSRQHTMDSSVDSELYLATSRRRATKKLEITNRDVSRLEDAIPPPQGHVALVFTDIRNSTHLWEANGGMQTAISQHNQLLRRQLRLCGGYEVKTEGDAFMCSFPTTLAAVLWCINVQQRLLDIAWPLEILECEDGEEIRDESNRLIARGLSVRMGIHCGTPILDPDPTTHRMDYLGPVVNRASRISGCAQGGQIAVSAEVMREINATIFESASYTEFSHLQTPQAIDEIRRIGLKIFSIGEVKLKGLEAPESVSLIYPGELVGRHQLETPGVDSASGSRVQFSVQQMRELAMLAVRLETLTTSRVFRPLPARKSSTVKAGDEPRVDPNPVFVYGNPDVLIPAIDKASDVELMLLLDSLSSRIENALASLTLKHIVALNKSDGGDLAARRRNGAGFDVRTLQQLLSFLPS